MKKTLLLILAFVASIGAWAQTNLASGKTVSVIYQPTGTTAPENLSYVTDGNTATNVILPNSENDITAISIDLTEGSASKRIGSISVVQDGRHATVYKIYGTNTAPSTYSTASDLTTAAASWTTLVDCTNDNNAGGDDNVYTKTYSVADNSGFRYIVFVPSAQVYGVSLRQIIVYQYETPALTTITATAASTSLTVNETSQITANAYDQFSSDFSATFTYSSDNIGVATVSETGLITAVAAGTATITVTANGTMSTTIAITVTSAFVMPTTAPTTPTDNSSDVYAVYSPHYSATTYTATDGGWNGGHDDYSVETIGSYNVLKSTHCGQFGLVLPEGSRDVRAYKSLRASIYVAEDYNGTVANDNTKIADISLKAGEWNYINVNIDGNSMSTLQYLMFNTGAKVGDKANQTVVITDVYFSKVEVATPFDITSAGVVTGDVTGANVAAINASTSAVINLKDANIKENITINPANTNAVVVVRGTDRTPNESGAKVTAPNIVVFDGTYYRAKDGVVITITDADNSQPNYGFTIDAQQDGYKITRTIPAGKYVTTVLPATIAAAQLTGVNVYELTAATASEFTFTKIDAADIAEGKPYVLYSESGTTLTATKNDDLNLSSTEVGAYTVSGVTFKGTYAAIDADGNQWALQDGNIKKFTTGAKIGAFRAYFTDVPAEARSIFDDGNTTGINDVKPVEQLLNGKFYNLQGQEVKHPTKGIYIVNGKKIIFK